MSVNPCEGCPLADRPRMDKPSLELRRGGILFVGAFPDFKSFLTRGSDGKPNPTPFTGYRTELVRTISQRLRDKKMSYGRKELVMYSYACLCNPEFDRGTKRYKIGSHELARCSVYLKDYIEQQRPAVIVALGSDVYKVLGIRGTVSDRRRRPASYTLRNGYEIPVICTFDDNTVIKQTGLTKMFEADFELAFGVGSEEDAVENEAVVLTSSDEIVAELDRINERVSSARKDDWNGRLVAFDTETTSLLPHLSDGRIIAMSFSAENNKGLAFPYQHRDFDRSEEDLCKIRDAVGRLLTNPNTRIATANGGFDMKWLWSRGIPCKDHDWDVILAEHCLDEDKKGEYSLKDITRLRFPEYGNYEEELTNLRIARWHEKDERIRELVENAKASSGETLVNWWVGLSNEERKNLLGDWLKRGLCSLKDTSGLSSVKMVKRNGVTKPGKGYATSVEKLLRALPDSELPNEAKPEVVIPDELKTKTFEDVPLDMLLKYAAMDVVTTRLIATQQKGDMERDKSAMEALKNEVQCVVPLLRKSFDDITMPLSVELAHMELHGIRIDRAKAEEYRKTLEDKIAMVKDRLDKEVGYRFNPNSVPELTKILYEDMKLPVLATTSKGSPSTSEAVIEELYEQNHNFVVLDDILTYRKLTKTLGTYIVNWLEQSKDDGYIHCSFNQTGTATFRLSSSNPNLQNVPFSLNLPDGTSMNLKSLFIPDEGYDIYDLDIKNAEMRVLCAYSKDEHLISAFNDGKDLHSLTAAGISGIPYEQICAYKEDKSREEYRQRQVAKKVNFGTIYCMGPNTLKKKLWEDNRIAVTEQQAQDYLDGFFGTYPMVRKYIEDTKDFTKRHRFTYTFFGRRRRFAYLKYSHCDMERMMRQAVNARIQSTSSDMVMLCLIRLNRYLRGLGDGSQVLLTVHDSIPFQAPHGAHEHIKEVLDRIIVEETARTCPWLPVQWLYDCGWGPNYGDTHGEIH